MPILSPVTDNCPSWISGSERMAVEFFHDQISTKECFAGHEDRTRDRPHTRRTRIWSSYRARKEMCGNIEIYNYWLLKHWICCDIHQKIPILTDAYSVHQQSTIVYITIWYWRDEEIEEAMKMKLEADTKSRKVTMILTFLKAYLLVLTSNGRIRRSQYKAVKKMKRWRGNTYICGSWGWRIWRPCQFIK